MIGNCLRRIYDGTQKQTQTLTGWTSCVSLPQIAPVHAFGRKNRCFHSIHMGDVDSDKGKCLQGKDSLVSSR